MLAQRSHGVGDTKVTQTEYNATISIPARKYLTFVNSPPQSSFKKLFIGTELGKALLTMSDDKALLKGLKDEEVERGRIRRPPIPYIPPEDPIQESVEKIAGTKSLAGNVDILDVVKSWF